MTDLHENGILRVSIVDDHPMFRMGVVRGLEDEAGVEVVAQGATASDAVAIFNQFRPMVSILDLSMPGGGHAAIQAIRQIDDDALIVVLTASEQEADVFDAMKAGATGYVLKGVEAGDLVSVLRAVVEGQTFVSPGIATRVLAEMRARPTAVEIAGAGDRSASGMPDLTAREEQILSLVAEGHSNKEIGFLLSLKEKSIKHVMTRVLKKLQVRNRTEAALQMREWQNEDTARR